MELVQEYLNEWKPNQIKIKERYEMMGFLSATLLDGKKEMIFGFKEMNVEAKREPIPIHSIGSIDPRSFSRSFSRSRTEVNIEMKMLLDSDDLYRTIKIGDITSKPLVLITEKIKATVYTRHIIFHEKTESDGIFATVEFVASGIEAL